MVRNKCVTGWDRIKTDSPSTALHVFGGTTNDQVVTIESTSSSGIGAPDLSLFTNDPAIQNGETIGVRDLTVSIVLDLK